MFRFLLVIALMSGSAHAASEVAFICRFSSNAMVILNTTTDGSRAQIWGNADDADLDYPDRAYWIVVLESGDNDPALSYYAETPTDLIFWTVIADPLEVDGATMFYAMMSAHPYDGSVPVQSAGLCQFWTDD